MDLSSSPNEITTAKDGAATELFVEEAVEGADEKADRMEQFRQKCPRWAENHLRMEVEELRCLTLPEIRPTFPKIEVGYNYHHFFSHSRQLSPLKDTIITIAYPRTVRGSISDPNWEDQGKS